MTTNFIAKKITLTDNFKQQAESKLAKLDRFLSGGKTTVKLVPVKNYITIEVTVKCSSMIFRAEEIGSDKLAVLDDCVDNIIRKIRKNKTKLEKQIHTDSDAFEIYKDDLEPESEIQVVKKKTFSVKPMLVEEAILQMEMLGHSFFVFKDAESGNFDVVYKRSDGKYAVIESE